MRGTFFRQHRQLVSPVRLGWVHGRPVRFFAARGECMDPWFALYDFFEAVEIPENARQQIVRFGREDAPESFEAIATGNGIVLVSEYAVGRGLLELICRTPGFEEVVSEFKLATRQTVEAMAG